MFIAYFIIDVVTLGKLYSTQNRYSIVIFILLVLALFHYFFFLYNEKWRSYVSEFKHLSIQERRLGTFYVLLYLVFSVGFLNILGVWMISKA